MAGFVLGLGNAEAGLLATAPAPAAATAITLGAFLAFQVSLGQAISAATSAAEMTTLWPTLAAAGARITPVAVLPPETTGPRTTPPALEGAITVSQVTHRYPGKGAGSAGRATRVAAGRMGGCWAGCQGRWQGRCCCHAAAAAVGLRVKGKGAFTAPSLDHVELEIAPRKNSVAIVGASGSGKSTFAADHLWAWSSRIKELSISMDWMPSSSILRRCAARSAMSGRIRAIRPHHSGQHPRWPRRGVGRGMGSGPSVGAGG